MNSSVRLFSCLYMTTFCFINIACVIIFNVKIFNAQINKIN
jgi:hypothetical protein